MVFEASAKVIPGRIASRVCAVTEMTGTESMCTAAAVSRRGAAAKNHKYRLTFMVTSSAKLNGQVQKPVHAGTAPEHSPHFNPPTPQRQAKSLPAESAGVAGRRGRITAYPLPSQTRILRLVATGPLEVTFSAPETILLQLRRDGLSEPGKLGVPASGCQVAYVLWEMPSRRLGQQFGQQLFEGGGFHRLDEMAVEARLLRAALVLVLAPAG
jgi:hypothetical protein